MPDSIRRRSGDKPRSKSKPKYPLWQHKGTGQWARKIKGKHYYFGTVKAAALDEYVRVRSYLERGMRPPPRDDVRATLVELCNKFLTHKLDQVKLKELTQTSFDDYHRSCERLINRFGSSCAIDSIRPEELLAYRHELATKWGPTTIANEVNRVRVILRFGFDNGLVDKPIQFGAFRRP